MCFFLLFTDALFGLMVVFFYWSHWASIGGVGDFDTHIMFTWFYSVILYVSKCTRIIASLSIVIYALTALCEKWLITFFSHVELSFQNLFSHLEIVIHESDIRVFLADFNSFIQLAKQIFIWMCSKYKSLTPVNLSQNANIYFAA